MKCFLLLDPQDKFGPSISSSVVLCSFVLLEVSDILLQIKVVTWFRRSVSDYHHESPGSIRGPVYEGPIMDELTLWCVFLPELRFSPVSITPPMLHSNLHFTYPPPTIIHTLVADYTFPCKRGMMDERTHKCPHTGFHAVKHRLTQGSGGLPQSLHQLSTQYLKVWHTIFLPHPCIPSNPL
jgi:hypothetical protein